MNPTPRFWFDPLFDWWDAGHPLDPALWQFSPTDLIWPVIIVFALFCWIVGQRRAAREAEARRLPQQRPLPEVSTSKSKPSGPLFIPLDLGGVVVDLQPERDTTFHVLVSGTSGLGKSSSVVNLLDVPIGVLVIALDNTRPLQKRIHAVGGREWTNNPRECREGLDFLCFEPSVSSELIVAGLPEASGDSGQWRRAARARIWEALEQCDARGIERDWRIVIAALQLDTGDPEADRACKSWASKLEQVYKVMGQTFGPDLNLVDAMRRGEKVLCRVNRFLSPQDAPMIGAWLMVLGRVVAAEAGVPFVLIAEEAGQMGIFKQHISPISQAGRDRGVVLVAITQNPSKLPDEVVNNCSVHISFAHELKPEAEFAAMLLRLHYSQLLREAFPKTKIAYQRGRGWCYIRAPGLPTTLVQVPNPAAKAPALPRRDAGSFQSCAPPDQPIQPHVVILDTTPRLNGWRAWTPALPDPAAGDEALSDVDDEVVDSREQPPDWIGDSPLYRRWWDQCERVGPSILWSPTRNGGNVYFDPLGCLEWTGTVSRPANGAPARPRASERREHANPYRRFFELKFGKPPDPSADHLCGNTLCCEPEHLEPVPTIRENNAREYPRTKLFEAAGWTRVERIHQTDRDRRLGREGVPVHRWVTRARIKGLSFGPIAARGR